MRVLQTFYVLIYFTQGLSDGDTCPLLGGPSLVQSSARDRHPTKMVEDLSRASDAMSSLDLCHDRLSRFLVGLRDVGLLIGQHMRSS
jgi:hypothetical protein